MDSLKKLFKGKEKEVGKAVDALDSKTAQKAFDAVEAKVSDPKMRATLESIEKKVVPAIDKMDKQKLKHQLGVDGASAGASQPAAAAPL